MNTQTTRPQSATEFLATAASTLGERGKQYDPAGKQERSMTAIVAAFNAIYPRNPLTVHMGWQFMSLVKMVRGATKPHADSALDQVAYAALAAEEVASQFVQPAALCEDEGCPHHGTLHVCVTSVETPEQLKARHAEQHAADIAKVMEARPIEVPTHFAGLGTVPTTAGYARVPVRVAHTIAQVAELERTNQELAEELGKCQHLAGLQSQVLKHLTDKLAAQQELLRVAQHNANFYFDKTNSCIAANESMTAKFQAERKANVAMHEEVTRLRGEVQELAALAEYRDTRNAELCAELETQRGKCVAQSSRLSELSKLVENLRADLARVTKDANSACAELSSAQDEIRSLLAEKRHLQARNKELEDKVQSLNNEVEAKVRELMSNLSTEAPCAHNTDEPKAPRPEYVDPYDSHGDIRSTMHRLVGDRDPARGGLAYPQGKPL